MQRVKLILALMCLAGLLGLPTKAAACPCAEFCGPVVAHGSSLYGVPWRVTVVSPSTVAQRSSEAEFHFSIGGCGQYSEAGYFVGLDLPISPRFAFRANGGSGGIDSYPEADLSGLTSARTTTLILRLSEASPPRIIHPQLAPTPFRARWHWLRRLRVFDAFFPVGLKPLELNACDRAGHAIASARAARNGFFALVDQGVGQRAIEACKQEGGSK